MTGSVFLFRLQNPLFHGKLQNMTLTQTVEITADRRITFEVPREVPIGWQDVIIQFPVKAESSTPAKRKLTAEEEAEHIERNFERINAEAMDVFEDQKWIFESDEGWEKE